MDKNYLPDFKTNKIGLIEPFWGKCIKYQL